MKRIMRIIVVAVAVLMMWQCATTGRYTGDTSRDIEVDSLAEMLNDSLRRPALKNKEIGILTFANLNNLEEVEPLGRHLQERLSHSLFNLGFRIVEIRLGKQMIVWGEIDGFRLLDLVNPFDLRQFILDDYEDSRMPQWGVDAKWRFWPGKPNRNLEFVFLPNWRSNYLMVEGSQWEVDELKVFRGGTNAFDYFDALLGPLYSFELNDEKPANTKKK